MPSSGDRGIRGTFSGGMTVLVIGAAGVALVGETEATGPGGGGVGPLASWLSEPGNTAVSES